MILGQKSRIMRLIASEDFFFREHHYVGTKFGFCERISDNFCPIRKVIENNDLRKCHKI